MSNPFEKAGKFQKKVSEPINPLFHVSDENKTIEPFIAIDNHPNDEDHFAILRTTENGKYVMGGLLRFVFNGVDIATDINNVIFIDRINKSVYIKDYSKVVEEITPPDPEERQYIILYTYSDQDGDQHLWEAMSGRNTTYEWIRDNIDELGFNPDDSFVLVETVPYKDALSVTQFVEYIKNSGFVESDDEFDIQNYRF